MQRVKAGADANAATAAAWERYRTSADRSVREELILAYLWLVPHVVDRLAMGLPRHVDTGDLGSHGVLGLIDALERYDPGRGVKFETYAVPWIRGAVLTALRGTHWSPELVRRVRRLETAAAELENHLGREPTAAELARHLGVSLRALAQRQREVGTLTVLSLDESASGQVDDDERRHERLADPQAPDPADRALAAERERLLTAALAALPPRERQVVELYYYEGLTLTEVSRVLGLSPARISQLHAKAVCRLRGRLGRQKSLLVPG